jgi:hypothetical protein
MKDPVPPCNNTATKPPRKEAVCCRSNRVRSTSLQFSLQPILQPKAVQKLNGNSCDCAECKIDGVRVPSPQFHRFHDCDYVRRRSRLVPQAERIANEQVPYMDGHKSNGAKWTRAFASAMDALAAPLLNGARSSKAAKANEVQRPLIQRGDTEPLVRIGRDTSNETRTNERNS